MGSNTSGGQVGPDDDDETPGLGSMIERYHNVTNREDTPQKKRKSQIIDEDDIEDENRKKAKSPFTGSGGDGTIGQHLKSERENAAAESGPNTAAIDLTNEEDDDDDVVFIGETGPDSNQEVCLGRLFCNAKVFKVPRVPKYQMAKVGKDVWPQARINVRRMGTSNNVIELFDRPSDGSNMGIRFGNMEITMAKALCPLMDGRHINGLRWKVFLDAFPRHPGEFPGGNISRSLKLSVFLYSPRRTADGIGKHLSQAGAFLNSAENMERSVEYYNPQQPKNYTPNSLQKRIRPQGSSQLTYGVTRTQEEMIRETTSMFDQLTKSDNLPEKEANSNIIKTPLLPHQKQALHFLSQHERANSEIEEDESNFSLWKSKQDKQGQVWYNVITNHTAKTKPECRGGILADVMGLGKTLSILALAADTVNEAKTFGQEDSPEDSDSVQRNSKATLIICPKSVMSNWTEQIKLHTKPNKINVYSYHGTQRTQDLDELAGYDIVLATYQTASAELGDKTGKRSALSSIQWFRVVLDEAHTIRNPATGVFKACCALSAQRRWAVTGTPVQNRLDDLGALIKFLKVEPFDDGTNWAKHIIAPFKNANEHVYQHLRFLVDSITLRRQKDNIGLTDRIEKRERLDFTNEEYAIYSQFALQSRMNLGVMAGTSNRLRGKAYAHVLKALGRMRAICAHGREMLSEDDLKELEGLTAGTAIDLGDEPTDEPDDTFVSEKHAYDTLNMMIESDTNICTGCDARIGEEKMGDEDPDIEDLSPPDTELDSSDREYEDDTLGYLTPCYHLICTKCKDHHLAQTQDILTADHYHRCIYCDQYVRRGLFGLTRVGLMQHLEARKKNLKRSPHAKWDESTYSGPSTKVKALLDDLNKSAIETQALPINEPPIRSVVFSGWTTYLDLIEHALEEHSINSVRLDGTMSIKARTRVLQTFSSDPTVTVLLVSIKAGGQGLNFTAANKVYMMEPQWNPGVEQQAIDRVHRLGQKRDVRITHYVMAKSVEEGIVQLQAKKEKLAKMSLEKKISRGEEAAKRMAELRELLK